ncbi:MAG: 4Fe-4S dicluster domain-containing protein [Deltaproteobacteria bacterium]|jgi:electron transport protein HydN|nr:4Fe-4S dicluster domain-containing protein [Deltaproteobacteria bacterium]
MNRYVQGDPLLCIGCRTCTIACVVAHEGKRIYEIDPDGYDFHPRLKVIKTFNVSVPVQCKHCENPACKSVCQSGAIRVQDGTVLIDRDKCIGCKSCTEACPFGAVHMVPLGFQLNPDGTRRSVAHKCDLCHGLEGGPACKRVCPTEALRLVESEDLAELLAMKRTKVLMTASSPEINRPV